MCLKKLITGICIIISFIGLPAFSDTNDDREKAINEFEPGLHVQKAVAMLETQLEKSADSRIPDSLLNAAKCVAVFPEVLQAGLGVGGKFGRGIVSCRQEEGNWGVPVFLRLTSLTVGAQVGAQTSDILLLVMQDDGLESLFSGKPIIGGEAGAAAGPLGRSASANIDIALQAPMVTYSRTQGLFAGAVFEGATITPAKKVNRGLYGDDYETARELLFSDVEVPERIQGLRDALEKYAPAS